MGTHLTRTLAATLALSVNLLLQSASALSRLTNPAAPRDRSAARSWAALWGRFAAARPRSGPRTPHANTFFPAQRRPPVRRIKCVFPGDLARESRCGEVPKQGEMGRRAPLQPPRRLPLAATGRHSTAALLRPLPAAPRRPPTSPPTATSQIEAGNWCTNQPVPAAAQSWRAHHIPGPRELPAPSSLQDRVLATCAQMDRHASRTALGCGHHAPSREGSVWAEKFGHHTAGHILRDHSATSCRFLANGLHRSPARPAWPHAQLSTPPDLPCTQPARRAASTSRPVHASLICRGHRQGPLADDG